MSKTPARAAGALALCVCLLSHGAWAWVYPEHRGITLAALEQLDPERRRAFDALWADARAGQDTRLCRAAGEREQGERPRCIDYAAWPAIAGDHSCSSRQMVDTILHSRWVLDVAHEAGKLGERLRRAKARSDVVNALRDSDIDLQRSDPEYATRAGANNAHFLLARPSFATTPEGYVAVALGEGVELNALAVYLTYHTRALAKARALAAPELAAARRAALSQAALADEAFALHFLQDAFAAGHVAGTRGSAALRKGTHDYYNEHGLEVATWRGERAVLTGDAWMRPEDARRAARAISKSLSQVIDAARGAGLAGQLEPARTNDDEPGRFDVCRATTVPAREHAERELLAEVLLDTPVPMLATGLGEMPRFRAELGPFVGVAAAARSSTFTGGFAEPQDSPGALAGLELTFRMGFGLEGVMNEAGDGLVFLDLGVRQDGRSSNRFGDASSIPAAGALTAAIPDRFGLAARLRVPFWLLPFDLLIAGPFLLLASPSTLARMAVTAGNGGLIPWQAGIATPIGRFQFLLGREVGVGLFGYAEDDDRLVVPDEVEGETRYTLIDLRSLQLELPIVEYRPFRAFSLDQSSSLVFQLFFALDIPTRVEVVTPVDNPEPDTKPVGHLGLRLSFDWRSYL